MSICTQSRVPLIARAGSPLLIVPSKTTFPVALPLCTIRCVWPFLAVTSRSGGLTFGRWTTVGFVLAGGVAGDLLPLAFHAEMTITVRIAITASATKTTFVSSRRWRRCGRRAAERRTRGSCSSPLTKRELNSSTYSCPSRPRYSAYVRRNPLT